LIVETALAELVGELVLQIDRLVRRLAFGLLAGVDLDPDGGGGLRQ